MDSTSRITVVGGGTMGRGIAVAALVTTDALVTIVESVAEARASVTDDVLRDASSRVSSLDATRLGVVADVSDAPLADLIVEAVPEVTSLKHAVLRAAEQRLTQTGVLTSNTSSLSITDLAAELDDPTRFLGMHFFQPVPDTGLTELIVHPTVSAAALDRARAWTERMNRTAISATDTPGFATSRLGLAIGLEAMRMVQDGVATAEDVDLGMQLGYQHAVGPLRMSDMVGLDVRLAIAEYLARTLGLRFEPPQILRDMVAEGKLGRKSGQGFFTWPE